MQRRPTAIRGARGAERDRRTRPDAERRRSRARRRGRAQRTRKAADRPGRRQGWRGSWPAAAGAGRKEPGRDAARRGSGIGRGGGGIGTAAARAGAWQAADGRPRHGRRGRRRRDGRGAPTGGWIGAPRPRIGGRKGIARGLLSSSGFSSGFRLQPARRSRAALRLRHRRAGFSAARARARRHRLGACGARFASRLRGGVGRSCFVHRALPAVHAGAVRAA